MKLLYGARLARFDLLRAINNLAAYITKWTPDCDKRLHSIMCYVHSTLKHRLVGLWAISQRNYDIIYLRMLTSLGTLRPNEVRQPCI